MLRIHTRPKVDFALKEAGAVLIRHKKHWIYRLNNGALVTISASPSDRRSEQNALRNIRKALAGR